MDQTEPSELVYAFVRTVPAGRVVTYGQAAALIDGVILTPRQVGGAMNVCPPDVPWQRVVGAGGHLPIGKRSLGLKTQQQELLEAEGVEFLTNGRVDMARFQWYPDETGVESPDGLL